LRHFVLNFDVKIFGLVLGKNFWKIISAFNDFGVYENSGNKFEGLRDQTICYQKSEILKNR
jgi:hypothetical protein